MSRVGRAPISIPKGAKVSVISNVVTVEGPKGKLSCKIDPCIGVDLKPEQILVIRNCETPNTSALHGLTRSLIANMVHGTTEGFKKILEVVGVGYRAEMKGRNLELIIGFSHPATYVPPVGVNLKTEGTTKIIVEGSDRQQVGQVAAEIRKIKKPDPYKGKGIKYQDEIIHKKAGKAAV